MWHSTRVIRGTVPAQFFNDLMAAGGFLNDEKLVASMAYESEPVLMDLEEMGVQFQKDDKGRFAVRQAAGSSFPRTVYYGDLIGPQIMGKMNSILHSSGAEIHHGSSALTLLKAKGRVMGALAFKRRPDVRDRCQSNCSGDRRGRESIFVHHEPGVHYWRGLSDGY